MKSEDVGARNDILPGFSKIVDDVFQFLQGDAHHCCKAVLFRLDHAHDIVTGLEQFRVGILHHVSNE